MKWMRKPLKDVVPRAVAKRAVFATECLCGSEIAIGEFFYYDPYRRASCVKCARKHSQLAQQGLYETPELTRGQKLIDRIRELESLPVLKPSHRSEIADCVAELVAGHAEDFIRFLRPRLRRSAPAMRLLVAKHAGKCAKCHLHCAAGALIAWNAGSHCIWCSNCVLTSVGLSP